MYILSQDKKIFAEYKRVFVSKKYSGKKGTKVFLLGIRSGFLSEFDGKMVLGSYESEETAIEELSNICVAMQNGKAAYAIKWGCLLNIENLLNFQAELLIIYLSAWQQNLTVHILWIIQMYKIPRVKPSIQNRLSYGFRERAGIKEKLSKENP